MIPADALQCVTCIKVQHYNHRSGNTQAYILLGTYIYNLHDDNLELLTIERLNRL